MQAISTKRTNSDGNADETNAARTCVEVVSHRLLQRVQNRLGGATGTHHFLAKRARTGVSKKRRLEQSISQPTIVAGSSDNESFLAAQSLNLNSINGDARH